MKLLPLPTKKFTVKAYNRMAESGIFDEGERIELIRGEIIEMSPVGTKHAACVRRLDFILSRKLGDLFLIDTQNPLKLNDNSQPQPDVVILKPRSDFYETEHPQPKDILLLIEVSDSSIEYDRNIKIPLYAENKIPEVWLVDINKKCVEVYKNYQDQIYLNIITYQINDELILSNFSEVKIKVKEIL